MGRRAGRPLNYYYNPRHREWFQLDALMYTMRASASHGVSPGLDGQVPQGLAGLRLASVLAVNKLLTCKLQLMCKTSASPSLAILNSVAIRGSRYRSFFMPLTCVQCGHVTPCQRPHGFYISSKNISHDVSTLTFDLQLQLHGVQAFHYSRQSYVSASVYCSYQSPSLAK